MSRSSDFWESIDNYRLSIISGDVGVSTGGFTTYNTGVMGSVVYDNGFFSEDLGFLIPFISRIPILEGKFLSKKFGLYTRKYGTHAKAVSALMTGFVKEND
jgi:hypothetical protein